MNEFFCCIAAIGMHIGSAHIDPAPWLVERGINNFNPGLMVEFKSGATAGAYFSTMNGVSFYGGYTRHFARDWKIHPVVSVGAVTYGAKTYAAGTIGLQGNVWEKWDARLVYVPKVEVSRAHVFHLIAVRNF